MSDLTRTLSLSRDRTAVLVVDIQEKLVPAMPAEVIARVTRNSTILIEAARKLGLPIVVSQQYPKGLGATIAPIEQAIAGAAFLHRFDKLEFSAAAAPEFGADRGALASRSMDRVRHGDPRLRVPDRARPRRARRGGARRRRRRVQFTPAAAPRRTGASASSSSRARARS